MYVQSHANLLPKHIQGQDRRIRGRPSQTELTMQRTGLNRSESNGIADLCEGDTKRKQGTSLIARQIELENMKARQFKAKEKVHDKNLALR